MSNKKTVSSFIRRQIYDGCLPEFHTGSLLTIAPKFFLSKAFGVYSRRTQRIWLNKTAPISIEELTLVYLHELSHWGVHMNSIDINLQEEEDLCDSCAIDIYTISKKCFTEAKEVVNEYIM